MNFSLLLNYNSYIKFFVFCFLLVGSFACEQQQPENNAQQYSTESDSILTLIDFGRNSNLPTKNRLDYLSKAFETAESERNDSLRLMYYSKIQWSFLNLNDSTWFRKTNKEANVLAKKMGDSLRLAGSDWDLGAFFDNNNIKDSAYFHFFQAQKIYEALGNNKNAGKLEYDMASIQADVKNYTSAEVGTIRAIELLKPYDENVMLYRCYNLLGIISKDLGEYENSLQYFDTASSYLEKTNAKDFLTPQIQNNIGVTFQEKGNHTKAIDIFKGVLALDSFRIKRPSSYAKILNNLASSENKLNPKEAEVEEKFLAALKIRDSLKEDFELAGSHYQLAEYYLEKKDTSQAMKNALGAKLYAELSGNNERLLASFALLIQLDSKNASSYGQRYLALNDSLQQEERKTRNKFARIRFETDEVVAENQLLTRQNQLWTGIALAILLLGTAGYIIVSQRAKNEKLRFEQEQQASNEKIFNLMLSEKQKFEEGKKIEQKRISEELHDGVLGKMLGARMVLTGLNKKVTSEAISERAEALASLKNVEGEVRSISHELSHAAYLQIHNFIRSINDLLKNIGDAANINYIFNYDEELDWDGLNGDIKINLYRMVQESLQNAVKHSNCENIKVEFNQTNDELNVLIKDDGAGFVMNKKRKKGIGMRNLRSRIEKLNGKLHIDSKLGEGTSVNFTIPIQFFAETPENFDKLASTEEL